MSPAGLLKISKGTRVVLAITLSVTAAAVVFAYFYFRSINSSADPRTLQAREMLARYDRLSLHRKESEGFFLLDSADKIFSSLPGYERSYERGVIQNNRCSVLLLSALYDSALYSHEKKQLFEIAMRYCDSSILCYSEWKREWAGLTSQQIEKKLSIFMKEDDPAFQNVGFRRVFERRIKEIIVAGREIDRRLSVSYTNRGTIFRHLLEQDSAFNCYSKALMLWEHNRTAESNMSVLMGGEPVNPGFIESLFPPDRKKN